MDPAFGIVEAANSIGVISQPAAELTARFGCLAGSDANRQGDRDDVSAYRGQPLGRPAPVDGTGQPVACTLPMVKAYIDDQVFTYTTWGGVSRYFVELMRAFRADASLGIDLTNGRLWTQNRHLIEAGLGRPLLPGRMAWRGRSITRQANRLRRNQGSMDLVHHTQYDKSYLRRYDQPGLRVVTVYDMIPEIYPEMFPHGNPHKAKRVFIDASDLIFCISEATKRDLIEIFGVPAAPIVVTHLGVDATFRPNSTKPAWLPDQYILYVGRRVEYKDFGVLAEAFAASRIPNEVMLILAGGDSLTDVESDYLERLGIAGRVRQKNVSDRELAGAYANALCFVFPSRYEGFGLPTLEAMAAGCPTILAASSSHPEVGGDAAAYFPPGDIAELSRLVVSLVLNPDLRANLRNAGLMHAAHFSWNQTARLTAAAYLSLDGK